MVPFSNQEAAGFLPLMLHVEDPRPAAEQFHSNYSYGGGWVPFEGFRLDDPGTLKDMTLRYSGDPPLKVVSWTLFRGEKIYVFQCSWVCIVQEDGSYEVARMD